MKIYDLWETKDIKVEDPGLRRYVSLKEKLVIRSHGREKEKFGRSRMHIVERFINLLQIPGHRGRKHKMMTPWATGKWSRNTKTMLNVLKLIEQKTKENPVHILIKAIENAAPRDEITTIEYGGARYPQAVDISPIRRISVAMRNLRNAAYDKSFGKKTHIVDALAAELISASQNSNESKAIQKKNETEKMADASR